MDQPIINPRQQLREMEEPVKEKEPLDVYERFENAVYKDDKDEFFRLINVTAYVDSDAIFENDAINIGIAMLNGKTSDFIDLDYKFNDKWTPLHLAASKWSPKLIKYLIQRGDHVHVDLFKLALDMIECSPEFCVKKPWTPTGSIFELLFYVCENRRYRLEAVRLLVQNTPEKDPVTKAFLDYANKGKLVQLTALFLAAPELFLSSEEGGMSSIDMLYRLLNSREKRTDIEDAVLLLLDVFTLVGHKLIAYLRVDDPKVLELHYYYEQFKIGFFVREVAHKKLGISSADDYLLRFFKPVRQGSSNRPSMPEWWLIALRERNTMKLKDIDMDYVNRKFPSLNRKEAAIMNTAIEKKLSTMPSLRNLYEGMIQLPKTGEKQMCSFPSVGSFEPSVRFFSTKESNAKHRFDFKVITPTNGWESRVMQPTKLKPFFPAVRLSHFPMIAKRLIK